jgi:hypothetical protein
MGPQASTGAVAAADGEADAGRSADAAAVGASVLAGALVAVAVGCETAADEQPTTIATIAAHASARPPAPLRSACPSTGSLSLRIPVPSVDRTARETVD